MERDHRADLRELRKQAIHWTRTNHLGALIDAEHLQQRLREYLQKGRRIAGGKAEGPFVAADDLRGQRLADANWRRTRSSAPILSGDRGGRSSEEAIAVANDTALRPRQLPVFTANGRRGDPGGAGHSEQAP